MIFLTVGTQLPFDRLVKAVDMWCGKHPDVEVFGQIAEPASGGYYPENFAWKAFIEPSEFDEKYKQSKLVVAHAGMGSIISALTQSKPILVMPRRTSFKEHRNDHQLATVEKFRDRKGVNVAMDDADLGNLLSALLENSNDQSMPSVGEFADPSLISALRNFIFD